jgi:hypothetical protein
MLNSQRGAELIVGYQKASPTPPKKIETMHFGDGSATNHLDHSRSVSQWGLYNWALKNTLHHPTILIGKIW